MRTVVGAAEPDPERPPIAVPFATTTSTVSSGGNATVTVTAWPLLLSMPAAAAAPQPYRTTAFVGEPIREIER